MVKRFGILFWLWLIVFSVFVILPIFQVELEWTNKTVKAFYEDARPFIIPFLIALSLTFTLSKNDRRNRVIPVIGVTFSLCLFAFVMLLFGGLCSYTNEYDIYRNAKHPHTSIRVREFGCGATTENTTRTLKVVPFTSYFNLTSDFDTTFINKNEWRPVL